MTNRTDVQNDCIDAYAAKTGGPDDSVTPTVVSEFIQVLADNVPMVDELPYTLTPELVTFDRDIQVPQNSINIGDAIKMSDLAQSIGYQTAFDEKQYILMGYEITADESKRPSVKDFSAPSSFVLQPVEDVTQSFTTTLTVLIPAVQQVIGKTYSIKGVCDQELSVKVYRLADNGGVDTLVVSEELEASQTNIGGFNFDLVPLVDFELNKNYRIELTPMNGGTLEIKGGLLGGNFVPYIERVLGWEYVNKELSYREEGMAGLYPVFIDDDETLTIPDRLVICQPVFASRNIELTLPDIQDANDNKYFVEVYNASENDDYDVIIKDNAGTALFSVKSRERMLYFPIGNSWESIVLSTQVFTDETITGTGSYSDPLSASKLYAHTGVTNDSPVSNATDTPLLVDTWNLTIPDDGLYNVHVTVEYNINTNSRDAIFRFDVNGSTGININQEGKDLTNNVFFTTFAFDNLTAGNNVIEFYASIESPQSNNRVEVMSNRYTAQKIDVVS